MLRVLRLGITAGMLGVLLIAPGANAARPTVFMIDIVFDSGEPPNVVEGSETFFSDGRVICASGPAVTDESTFHFAGAGRLGRGNGTFHLEKTLICANGTIRIAVDAAQTKTGTIGGWVVKGGTGAYAGVTGAGQIIGVADPGGGLDLRDYYTGRLTN